MGSTHNAVDLTDADNETVPMMAKEEDVIVEDVTGEEGEEETASVRSTTLCVDPTPVVCNTPVVGARPSFARAAAAK